MPKLRAITAWADRKTGDEFDATDIEARILTAHDLPGGQKAEYIDRAMQPVDPTPPATVQEARQAPQEKRRYMRRDMQAQN